MRTTVAPDPLSVARSGERAKGQSHDRGCPGLAVRGKAGSHLQPRPASLQSRRDRGTHFNAIALEPGRSSDMRIAKREIGVGLPPADAGGYWRSPLRGWNAARWRPASVAAMSLLLALVATSPSRAAQPRPVAELAALIDAAQPGETITVPHAVYQGTLHITKPIVLVGEGNPVIDAGGQGDVVQISAPNVTLRGFTIRGSGKDLDRENTGIRVEAADILVENNIVEDILFGIDLREAPNCVIRGNSIGGKDLDIARRGDGLRLWRANNSLIEGNTIHDGRDAILWYSEHVTLRRNTVRRGRYGFHFMYTHHTVLEDNDLRGNSVGVYIMYSNHIHLRRNVLADSRGPSGYGLGLKDADDIRIEHNLITANRVGIYVDHSPFSDDSQGLITRNVIGFNDQGMAFAPAVRGNILWENAFLENQEQVALLGRGEFKDNDFAKEGRGNYWADYTGFDKDRDGVGDMPYTAVSLFESLMDREPRLRLFLHTPAQQAVEFTGRALPEIQPEPKFSDPSPLMSLPEIDTPAPPPATASAMGWCAAALLSIGTLLAFPGFLLSKARA